MHRCHNINSASRKGCYTCVEEFLKHGEDVNQVNITGISCLHQACFHNHPKIVKLLLEHGADPYLTDIFGRRPLDVCHSKEVKNLLVSRT